MDTQLHFQRNQAKKTRGGKLVEASIICPQNSSREKPEEALREMVNWKHGRSRSVVG